MSSDLLVASPHAGWRREPAAPPGWYPDPSGADDLRYWDGSGWTGYVRAAPPPEVPLSPLPARALLWGLAGMGVAVGVAVFLSLLFYLPTASAALAILASEVGLWSVFFGTCMLVSERFGTGDLRADYGLGFRPVDAGYGLLSFFACLLVAGLVGSLFVQTRLRGSNTGILSGAHHNVLGIAVVAGIATIGAPIFEELFFRGLIMRALQSRVGPVAAVWLQAGLFSVGHYQVGMGLGNVSVMVGTFSLGVVLGYTALRTRRLAAGMIAHALFNGLIALSILARR